MPIQWKKRIESKKVNFLISILKILFNLRGIYCPLNPKNSFYQAKDKSSANFDSKSILKGNSEFLSTSILKTVVSETDTDTECENKESKNEVKFYFIVTINK